MKKTQQQNYSKINSSVIHIAPTPFFSNRGCHIRILNQIEGLRKNGVSVILCTYGLGNNLPGIDVRRIPTIPGYTKTEAGFSPYKFIADILLFFLVLKTVLKENVSILHGHLHEGGLIGWLVKFILFWKNIKVIMDTQGSLSGELHSYGSFRSFPYIIKLFYFLEKIISRLPNLVICSSPATQKFITQICGVTSSQVHLLGDVVPDTFFEEREISKIKQRLGVPLDKRVAIYTGSLLPGKGVDTLLEAMKLCLAECNDVFFICIGYPKEWVDDFVTSNNLERDVLVPGEVSYHDLAKWLTTANLAIDPKPAGSGEASGKILHYMACGLPVVCYETKNNIFFLEENCFYSPGPTAIELANTIRLAFEDSEKLKSFATITRKKAQTEFSLMAAGKKLQTLYTTLCN
ncbi:MAG: glycosyltransferase family 4 protein [Desulfobacteraceae bacterium]|nr:glycosyltransferase family 4 protein [Desulfobacteraceae bacterium]